MIKIMIIDDGKNNRAISLTGHAGYAEHGKDIVCAAVSTIFQLCTMGLRKLATQYPEHIKIMVWEEVKDE
jgi:uncharacterized protein YsxB (DUF464 family)